MSSSCNGNIKDIENRQKTRIENDLSFIKNNLKALKRYENDFPEFKKIIKEHEGYLSKIGTFDLNVQENQAYKLRKNIEHLLGLIIPSVPQIPNTLSSFSENDSKDENETLKSINNILFVLKEDFIKLKAIEETSIAGIKRELNNINAYFTTINKFDTNQQVELVIKMSEKIDFLSLKYHYVLENELKKPEKLANIVLEIYSLRASKKIFNLHSQIILELLKDKNWNDPNIKALAMNVLIILRKMQGNPISLSEASIELESKAKQMNLK